ncbi:type II toxin-antitoxin system VapC family toxin [Methylomonas sp. MgM2]
MKILFDTNVVLDVLLDRAPHSEAAIELLGMVETKMLDGALCATTITTVDYLTTKARDRSTSRNAIKCLLDLFTIADVNTSILRSALDSEFTDFEDAVLYYSGVALGVDGVVTRNVNDFGAATLPVYSPSELLSQIGS